MKQITVGALVLIFTVTGWLFATGNLPGTVFAVEGLPNHLNRQYPIITGQTTALCGQTWARIRKAGIQVPLSHNERILRIIKMYLEVDQICKEILLSLNYHSQRFKRK